MDSQTSFALISVIQEKLASVKKQLQIQTLNSGSLKSQIESLKSDFDALELVTEARNISVESIKSTLGALSRSVESTHSLIESTSSILESLRTSVESLSPSNGSMTLSDDSMKRTNGSLSPSDGSMPVSGGSTNRTNGSLSPSDGSTTLSGDALDISAELKTVIIKGAEEKLKRVFYFDTIPARLAGIVLAISKSQKLRISEMMKMFNISRNTAVRDLFLLKKLGLIKFSGGKSNGYFLLSDEGEKVLNTLRN